MSPDVFCVVLGMNRKRIVAYVRDLARMYLGSTMIVRVWWWGVDSDWSEELWFILIGVL